MDGDSSGDRSRHRHHIMGRLQCKQKMKELKEETMEKVAACPAAAQCFGVGERPEDENAGRWYDKIKQMRADLKDMGKDSMVKMKTCIQGMVKEGIKKYLPGFNVDAYSEDFFEMKPMEGVGCEDEVWACIEHVHHHAKRCALDAKKKFAHGIQQCMQDDPSFNETEMAWQTASQLYHERMDICLSHPDLPPPIIEPMRHRRALHRHDRSDDRRDRSDDSNRRDRSGGRGDGGRSDDDDDWDDDDDHYRFKREIDSPEEGRHHHYGGGKMCFKVLKKHKEKCKQKSLQCPRMAACLGIGEAPTEENDLEWYNTMKPLREDKEQKVNDHLPKVIGCAGIEQSSEEEEEALLFNFF